LPIAVATIIATGQAPAEADGLILLGELAWTALCATPRYPADVAASHENGFSRIVVPEASAREASLVDGVEILPFANLAQLAAYLRKEIKPLPIPPQIEDEEYIPPEMSGIDFAYIKGQEHVKRALEIAAAGGHNVVMMGPPAAEKPCWRVPYVQYYRR